MFPVKSQVKMIFKSKVTRLRGCDLAKVLGTGEERCIQKTTAPQTLASGKLLKPKRIALFLYFLANRALTPNSSEPDF